MLENKKLFASLAPERQVRAPAGSIAVHEAGHAVACWYLDRVHYLGRHVLMPYLQHVAIALDGGGVQGSRCFLEHCKGVCAGDPCILWPTMEPPPPDYPYRDSARVRACADIIHTMAGPIAQNIHEGEPIEDAWDWRMQEADVAAAADNGEMGTDSWHVECHIALLGRRWRLHLERAFETADKIVRDHQPHITALADALIERGLIDGEDVYTLFDQI